MSVTEVIIRLALVALLASYLVFKHCQRERQRVGSRNPAEWTGKGIDVTALKPTLEEVRRSYPRPSQKGACFHRGLLALARRAVTDFAYFQEQEEQPNGEKHAQ
jgi:hypothetical protein